MSFLTIGVTTVPTIPSIVNVTSPSPRRMVVLTALLLPLLLTTACTHASLNPALAGDYELHGVLETASALRLTADGKYKFGLSLGSVDEFDEGNWRIDGSDVLLHSTVADDAPGFSFVRSGRDSEPGVRVLFEGADARAVSSVVSITMHADGKTKYMNEIDGALQRSRTEPPVERLKLFYLGVLRSYPVYEHVPVDPNDNLFVFRTRIGNYGKVRFQDAALSISGEDLILKPDRVGQEFRYVRIKAKSPSQTAP